MSVTIFWQRKHGKSEIRLSLWQIFVIASVLVGITAWQVNQYAKDKLTEYRIRADKEHYAQSKHSLAALKQNTEQQVLALSMKMGELQGQVNRLNAVGHRLAEKAEINQQDLAFDQATPLGGPAQEVEQVPDIARLLNDMEQMLQTLDDKERQLTVLESVLLNHHIANEGYISGRPIDKGWLSSYYGVRKDPFTGNPAMHKGIDFAGDEGGNVVSTGAGVVSWAGERYGYGLMIEIDHGGLKTRYGHNSELLVEEGDVVTKGELIARMGSTGRSTGPHVHYEVLRGNVQIDPLKYVYRKALK